MAAAGVGAMLVLLLLPGLRAVPVDRNTNFPTVYFAAVAPAMAILVAMAGLLDRNPKEKRTFNLIGIAIAFLAIGLAFFATPRSRSVDRAAPTAAVTKEKAKDRDDLTPKELAEWRRKQLDQFNQ